MSNNRIVCPSCSTDNKGSSEFCINCGIALENNIEVDEKPTTKAKMSDEERQMKEYRDWKKSVPYTVSAAIFITFIDLVTGGGNAFEWSYWATVPLILFAVLAPAVSYKMIKS